MIEEPPSQPPPKDKTFWGEEDNSPPKTKNDFGGGNSWRLFINLDEGAGTLLIPGTGLEDGVGPAKEP
jgi:hypothetical protein